MSLRQQPYLPLYVQDFMTDEKLNECSAESTGVYIRLMCVMHKSKDYGKILLKQKYKQTPEQSSGRCFEFACQLSRQMPYDVATIERALMELLEENVISLDGEILYQQRMVKDAELSDKRAKAGKQGGDKRKKKEEPTELPMPKQQEKTAADTQSKRFEEFWTAYPKKVGKGAARKSWAKIRPDAELYEKILNAIAEAKTSEQWQAEHGKYIPNPATWLNQSRWEDELTKKGTGDNCNAADWRDFEPSGDF